jgi:hypothetical protein
VPMTTQPTLTPTSSSQGADLRRLPNGLRPETLIAASLLMVVAGLAVSAAMGGVFPSPFGDGGKIAAYFAGQPDAVRAGSFFVFASAVPLAVGAAAIAGMLRRLGAPAQLTAIAIGGGFTGAALMASSGLLMAVLARPEVREDLPIVHAVHYLAFLTGGVAHVVFFGLLLGAVAASGMRVRAVSRPIAAVRLLIAAIAGLATLSLLWPQIAFLVPVVRFPGLLWLLLVGYRLSVRARAAA